MKSKMLQSLKSLAFSFFSLFFISLKRFKQCFITYLLSDNINSLVDAFFIGFFFHWWANKFDSGFQLSNEFEISEDVKSKPDFRIPISYWKDRVKLFQSIEYLSFMSFYKFCPKFFNISFSKHNMTKKCHAILQASTTN